MNQCTAFEGHRSQVTADFLTFARGRQPKYRPAPTPTRSDLMIPSVPIAVSITGRIEAIAKAQDFLSISCSKQGSDLRDLVRAIVDPLCPEPCRIQIKGAAATLSSDTTTSFALILHELSTNADCAGTVEIAWGVESDRLSFTWREQNIQISITPRRRGFGSRLFQMKIGGLTIDHKLHPGGVECMITVKVPV
jgi:two-component sensor histidine kinase